MTFVWQDAGSGERFRGYRVRGPCDGRIIDARAPSPRGAAPGRAERSGV